MKAIFTLIFCVLSVANASGLNAREAELSAQDLASFIGLKHKTFTFEHDGTVKQITYRVNIYQNGKVIQGQTTRTDATSSVRERTQRYSVLYKDEGSSIRVAVVGNGMTSHFDVEKPKGVGGFPLVPGGVKFDGEGRLILGFDVEKNAEGGSSITEENSTVEGAKVALVFQIEME